MNYWLIKSEPDAYSIDDLYQQSNRVDHWDGIRNYQARNFMRDTMQIGDQAFFYHSSCAEPGIVGTIEIASHAYVDHTQFDPQAKYYDPKSSVDKPRWIMVDVKFMEKLPRIITLKALKSNPQLTGMRLLQKGNRLSILPIEINEWQIINQMRTA